MIEELEKKSSQKLGNVIVTFMAGLILVFIGVSVGLLVAGTDAYKNGIERGPGGLLGSVVNSSGIKTSSSYKNNSNVDFDLFWDVWDELAQKYVDKDLDEKTLIEGAAKGLVDSLGDHATVFYTKEETEEYDRITAGEFEGIGAEMGYRGGQIIIKSPLKGSPAEKSGLRPGDAVLAVDGESTEDMTLTGAVMQIRGEKGTEVKLTVISEGESKEKDILVTREPIYIPSVEYKDLGDGVYYVSINRFTDDSFANFTASWDKVVDDLVEQNAEKIILDMRSNPGGFLDGASYIASDFLPVGTVVMKTEGRNDDIEEYKVTRKGKLLDLPMVILVNGGTASASEILAGALSHYNRAEIIGEKTVGKGTSQSVLKKNEWDGASLHITIQKWLLPDGSWLNPENPIVPDVEVELTTDDYLEGKDPQFEKAVEMIGKL